MRILHTADWHVGKRLGRYDRMDDHRSVLAEVVEIADREEVDLVLVAGDLFDRPTPPVEALRVVLDALVRLAREDRPVVAISGNHDSGELFELLAPLLRSENVHLVGAIRPPDEGGILELETSGGRAAVGCFPFLPHGRAVDFTTPEGQWAHRYAARVASVCTSFDEALARRDDALPLLVAHMTLDGVRVGGRGGPRGERELHLGEAYTAPSDALPGAARYVAMGHIHLPQPLPRTSLPGEYSGSLLELDFGEAGEEKRVLVLETTADGDATRRNVPLTRGRRLRRVEGRWEELLADESLRDVYVDLGVTTAGPDPGLADRAREAFPYLVKVRAVYPRSGPPEPGRRHLPWDEQYRDYFRESHETEPSPELLEAFREVWSEVRDAPA